MARTVVVYNGKGGVGKTTTSTNLAAGLARKGLKVLLIDLDRQANATSNLLAGLPEITILDLFHKTHVENVIYQSVEKNLHIIPSCPAFSVVEAELVSKIGRESILKKAISPIVSLYDVIVIDTPPAVNFVSLNGLYASDEVIIPVCGGFSLDGVAQIMDIFTELKENLDYEIKICGVLLTMYVSRTLVANDIKESIEKSFGNLLFETKIPRNVKLEECPSHNQSIFQYAPISTGAEAYMKLTDEVMTRWGLL